MFYITTPIPYVNGSAHLGHLLEAIFNDVIARYKRRLLTEGVQFSMGLDQNGLKVYQKAQEKGLETSEFVVQVSRSFKDLWEQFEISHDVFIETATELHQAMAQLVWRNLAAKNLIYKKRYRGLYCVGCESFYSPSQLDEQGNCPTHQKPPQEMTEENYFFKLSQFTEEITRFLRSGDIRPDSIRREWLSFLKEGLEDISISRERQNLPWGVPVPGDKDQVMYVWFEALVNYLTGVADLELLRDWQKTTDVAEKTEKGSHIWQEIQDKMPIDLVFLGKDIAKFHVVVWIGMREV